MVLGFFVGYKFLATCKNSERQRDREMTGQTEVHISKNCDTTQGPIKQTELINIAEETVFIQTLAVLPPTPIIFGIKHFDT